MTPDQLKKLSTNLEKVIKTTVNGKVDSLRKELQEYITKDNEWKDSVTPTIEEMKKMQNFASVGGTILKAIVLIGAAISAVIGIIKISK